jgi:hypothetical protein
MGSTLTAGYNLTDPEGQRGIYYVFYDLSVRVEGNFRLKFSLVDLSDGDTLVKTEKPQAIQTAVFSEPFVVLPQKTFPGMAGTCISS